MDKFYKILYNDMQMLLDDYDKLLEDNVGQRDILNIAFVIGKILGQNEVLEYIDKNGCKFK